MNRASASSRLGTSVAALWVGPARWFTPILGVLLLALAWWLYASIESATTATLSNGLRTILLANRNALGYWLDGEQRAVELWASDSETASMVRSLAAAVEAGGEEAGGAAERGRIRERLAPLCGGRRGYLEYIVLDRDGLVLADLHDDSLGRRFPLPDASVLAAVFDGAARVTPPFRFADPAHDSAEGGGRIVLAALAPVRGESGSVVAALAFLMRHEDEFSEILQGARVGENVECYAFDARGVLLSRVRYEDELRELGLLPPDPERGSALLLALRDPGCELAAGGRPEVSPGERPFTRAVAQALSGVDGFDVNGYRDVRGVTVLGVWTYLERYGYWIVFEVEAAAAYAPVVALRRAYWALLALLAVVAILAVASSRIIGRLHRAVRETRQLGQYVIEGLIGEGGMGQVYKARHALLRRPTAVKLLRSGDENAESMARFEREVMLTSRLTHPNTIAIYDYGHTPDGVFYYAMEYLSGITLEALVRADGAQPEARVVHFLRQISGSLSEAHGAGMIHRDIKPANIMICERGGQLDVVKVLDFGLVKEVEARSALTFAGSSITGTPLYMPPEAIRAPESVDARSDLYSLGAVAYYLVTGFQVFEGKTVFEVCSHHLNSTPVPPSVRRGAPVCETLESLILRCLEKDPAARPQHARELLDLLEGMRECGEWRQQDAAARWARCRAKPKPPAPAGVEARAGMTLTIQMSDRLPTPAPAGAPERT